MVGVTHALLGRRVTFPVAVARVTGRLTWALTNGAVRAGEAHVTEASALITDPLRRTVVLTLGNLAGLARPAMLARARAVEAVPMRADAALTLHQATVTPVESVVADAAASRALAVAVAVGGPAQPNGTRRPTPAVRAKTLALATHPVHTRRALPSGAIDALKAFAAQARGVWLTRSVLGALLGARACVALHTSPAGITRACAIFTFAVGAIDVADVQRAVGAGEKSNAVALAIATFAIVAAIFRAFLLGAVITGVVIDTNALHINASSTPRT